MKKFNKKGFTMVELLIVLAIIAILAAVAIPVYSSQLENTRKEVDNSNLRAATGMASQDFLLRNAARPWTNFSNSNQTYYSVFTFKDDPSKSGSANSKNMMVFPASDNTMYVDNNGIWYGKNKPQNNFEDGSNGKGITYGFEKNKKTKADREKPLGKINDKTVCHYPIQQNGGNGYFHIVMGPNGVIKESKIVTTP